MSQDYVLASELKEKYQISYATLINRAQKIGIRHTKGGDGNRNSLFTKQQVARLDLLHEFMKKNRNISAFLLQESRTADGTIRVDYEDTVELEPVGVWDSDETYDSQSEATKLPDISPLRLEDMEFIAPPADSSDLPPGVEDQMKVWFGNNDNSAPFIFDQFWRSGLCITSKQIQELVKEIPQGDTYQFGSFVFVRVQQHSAGDQWKVNKAKLDTGSIPQRSVSKLKHNHLLSNGSQLLTALEENKDVLNGSIVN